MNICIDILNCQDCVQDKDSIGIENHKFTCSNDCDDKGLICCLSCKKMCESPSIPNRKISIETRKQLKRLIMMRKFNE